MYNRKIVAEPLEVSRAKIIMKNRRRRRSRGYYNNDNYTGGGNTYITNNYYYGNERHEEPQQESGVLVSDLMKQYSQEENVEVQKVRRKPKLNRNYEETPSSQIDDEVLKEVLKITLKLLRK